MPAVYTTPLDVDATGATCARVALVFAPPLPK
jgi:hypothetical protein